MHDQTDEEKASQFQASVYFNITGVAFPYNHGFSSNVVK